MTWRAISSWPYTRAAAAQARAAEAAAARAASAQAAAAEAHLAVDRHRTTLAAGSKLLFHILSTTFEMVY